MSEKIENSTADLLNSMRNHINALADEKVIDPVRLRYAVADRKVLAAQFHAEGLSNRASAEALGVDERTVRRDLAGAANAAATAPASHWSTVLGAANAAGLAVPWDVEAVAKMLDSTDRFIRQYELRDQPMTKEIAEEFTSRVLASLALISQPNSSWQKYTPEMLERLEQRIEQICGERAS
jgi:hypothetical protein